jgi:hypothetical protein
MIELLENNYFGNPKIKIFSSTQKTGWSDCGARQGIDSRKQRRAL